MTTLSNGNGSVNPERNGTKNGSVVSDKNVDTAHKRKKSKSKTSKIIVTDLVVNDTVKLKREIGLLEAVAITVGSIIGSGIFISPKGIVQHVGSIGGSLVVWIVSGILSLMGAFCYAELGCAFPSAGGSYTYLLESFGPNVAFVFLWFTNIVHVPLSNAILGLTFAKYVVQPFFPIGCYIPDMAVRLLSMVAILVLTAINCQGVRQASKVINVFMYLKIFALGLIIAAGVLVLATGQQNQENLDNLWTGTVITAESVVYSIFSGSFAFGGWQAMSTMMEELKEPEKNLPRAIFISIGIVTFVYVLTNLAYFTVLTPTEMISSDAVAVTFIGKFWGSFVWIVPVFVAVSNYSPILSNEQGLFRYCYVGARNGQFPNAIGLISVDHHTPVSSIIFISILSIFLMYTSDLFALINLLSIVVSLFQALIYAASIYFHLKRKDIERTFKVPIILPILNLIISLLFFIIPVYLDPMNAAISVVLILPGVPIYYLIVAREKALPWIKKIDGKIKPST
ncbi:Y+L amino acid transporter 1 [Orchesella cincta]|uniref:Y+L amino acid transporter 1 n=1 Tax=Orchesella cincta TaxID=48709 RepID=A0A1D2NHS3_ORCCI|nr:Y+L amino acid transporter 1 [Orchesella cincta]